MKKALTAGLVLAGVMAVSGSAFAGVNVNVNIDVPGAKIVASKQTQKQRPPEPPEGFQKGQRPPMMSRDIGNGQNRPPMPPRSGDKRPPEFDGKKPQKRSKSN